MECKVSICIPTYEMAGFGESYLNYSLSIIAQQDYKNLEVVISDHSAGSGIEKLCHSYRDHLDIRYTRNKEDIGNSSANLNNAIANASGDTLKILFQDDFLLTETAISNQVTSLVNSNRKWSVTACVHTDDNETLVDPYHPYYQQNILFTNTLSSPSVLMMYRDYCELFDKNLLWYMDTDVYYRLGRKYGEPAICEAITVVNRRHKHQITNTRVNDEVINKERVYLMQKYNL